MATTEYKYKIHTLLRKLPVEEYEVALKWFPIKLGISKDTFRAWIYIKSFEPKEIPGTALLFISNFFGINPDELFTYPVAVLQESNKETMLSAFL